MSLYSCTLATPLGQMLAVACDQGLCLLEFCDQKHLARELAQVQAHQGQGVPKAAIASITAITAMAAQQHPVLAQTETQLGQYFARQRRSFDLPLQCIGTPFQRAAWQALLHIPYGQTRSYAAQAQALGKPSATRAVAAANGANKISIVVPCHRVIGSDGSLTGFGGGLARKLALLTLESGHDASASPLIEAASKPSSSSSP